MPALPISNVRQNLFGLVQQVNDDHDPLTVVTKTGENAVLVAESDWNSLMETLYVLQSHGGVHLLKSAQDARDGLTQSRSLIDADVESTPPAELAIRWVKVFDDKASQRVEDKLNALLTKLYVGSEGVSEVRLIAELRRALADIERADALIEPKRIAGYGEAAAELSDGPDAIESAGGSRPHD